MKEALTIHQRGRREVQDGTEDERWPPFASTSRYNIVAIGDRVIRLPYP